MDVGEGTDMHSQNQIASETHRSSQAFASPVRMSDRALRVLIVVESSGGGTGRHVLDLAEGLIARGCDVHLLYSTGRMDRHFRERLIAIRSLVKEAVAMRTAIHISDLAAVRAVCRYVRAAGPFEAADP